MYRESPGPEVSSLEPCGTPTPFECTWQEGGSEAAWVRVAGDVDLATAPPLQAIVSEALDGARIVVVDLRGVTFMDSSGLYVLVEVQQKASAKACRLVFVRGTPSVDRLLEVTGVHEQLLIVDLDPAEPPAQALLAPAMQAREALAG